MGHTGSNACGDYVRRNTGATVAESRIPPHLCVGSVNKSCKEPLDCDSLRCDKCYGQWGLSARRRAYGRGTVGTADCKSHYKRIYFGLKDLRTFYNRQLRRCYKGEIGNYGYYRKMFEIWYLM